MGQSALGGGRVKSLYPTKTSNPIALRIVYPKFSPCCGPLSDSILPNEGGDRLFTRPRPFPVILHACPKVSWNIPGDVGWQAYSTVIYLSFVTLTLFD